MNKYFWDSIRPRGQIVSTTPFAPFVEFVIDVTTLLLYRGPIELWLCWCCSHTDLTCQCQFRGVKVFLIRHSKKYKSTLSLWRKKLYFIINFKCQFCQFHTRDKWILLRVVIYFGINITFLESQLHRMQIVNYSLAGANIHFG